MTFSLKIFISISLSLPVIVTILNNFLSSLKIELLVEKMIVKRNLLKVFINRIYIPIIFSLFIWVQIEHQIEYLNLRPYKNEAEVYSIYLFIVVNLILYILALKDIFTNKNFTLDYSDKVIFFRKKKIIVDINCIKLVSKVTLRPYNSYFINYHHKGKKTILLEDFSKEDSEKVFNLLNEYLVKNFSN